MLSVCNVAGAVDCVQRDNRDKLADCCCRVVLAAYLMPHAYLLQCRRFDHALDVGLVTGAVLLCVCVHLWLHAAVVLLLFAGKAPVPVSAAAAGQEHRAQRV
jgi:hypothetical protein